MENDDENDDDEVDVAKHSRAAQTPASALMDKFPAFDPSWPVNIQEQWFNAFAKMQDMVKDK